MQSQMTIRLSDDLDKRIVMLAGKLHLKRSDVVRLALEKFLGEAQGEREDRPYDKVRGLIGSVSTGIRDLGESHREHLLKKLRRHA